MAEDLTTEIIDNDLRAIFIEEAREQLEVLDRGLVRLEHESDDVELIQEIFRAAHTLKGSSGMMGFRMMAELTHAMEDVLDPIRSHKLTVTTAVVDTLLQGLDLLRKVVAAVAEQQDGANNQQQAAVLAAALRTLVTHASETPETASNADAPLGPLPDGQTVLLVNFEPDCQMPSVRALMVLKALATQGEILSIRPPREAIDRGAIGHRLLVIVQSEKDEETLRATVRTVAEVQWVRAAYGAAASGMRLELPSRDVIVGPEDEALAFLQAQASGKAIPAQASVRIPVETLDRITNLVEELVFDRTRVAQLKDELRKQFPQGEFVQDLDDVSYHLGSIVGELQTQMLQARMLPLSQLLNRFPRLIRDLCRVMNKAVDLKIDGEEEQLDRAVIEKLVDPLMHLLRNAVDHGMEPPDERERLGKSRRGTVRLSAQRDEDYFMLYVSDDGPGLDAQKLKQNALERHLITPEQAKAMLDQEAYALIFASGFSTAAQVSEISGRGVGLEVVKTNIDSLGGFVEIDTEVGCGTTFLLKLPLTRA